MMILTMKDKNLISIVDLFKHNSQYHIVTNYIQHVPFIVNKINNLGVARKIYFTRRQIIFILVVEGTC
jgi:hypothetical protein